MHRVKLFVVVPLLLAIGACNRDPQAQAQRYVENGNKFFEKEKYKEASIMYRRALQKDPESAAYLNPYLQGQMTRKLELLRQAADLASAADDE